MAGKSNAGTWMGAVIAVAVLGSSGTATQHDAHHKTHPHRTHGHRTHDHRPEARPIPGRPVDGPAVLSTRQIAGYARGAGFRGRNLQVACAVALAESGGHPRQKYHNSDAVHSTDLGLMQINSYWNARWLRTGNWADPADSMRMAHAIWRARGWGDWVTYNEGQHRPFMNRCGRAAT